MLQIEFSIEIALDFVAGNPDLEVMPLLARGRGISNPGNRRAFAFFELPENQIILEAIRSKCQIIAICLQIEQYAGALIDTARQAFEPHGDFAAAKILAVLGDSVGV